jgi:hypothetical protein
MVLGSGEEEAWSLGEGGGVRFTETAAGFCLTAVTLLRKYSWLRTGVTSAVPADWNLPVFTALH